MKLRGARKWYFADGYIESSRRGKSVSHESLCLLNAGEEDANVKIRFFFSDRDPIYVDFVLPAERNVHLRLDDLQIPRDTPYGVEVISNVPIVAQLSRLVANDEGYTLMTTIGYSED